MCYTLRMKTFSAACAVYIYMVDKELQLYIVLLKKLKLWYY